MRQRGLGARSGEVALFFSGLLYGASTPVGRALGAWMQPAAITATRFTLASAFCAVAVWRTPRKRTASWVHLVPVGVLYAVAATLFTYAFFNGSIAVAIFGYYVANLMSALVVGVLVMLGAFTLR